MAYPNDEVCRIEVDPLNGRCEIKYSGASYSVAGGEWVGPVPSAARVRQIKAALTNALPKPKPKPKPKAPKGA